MADDYSEAYKKLVRNQRVSCIIILTGELIGAEYRKKRQNSDNVFTLYFSLESSLPPSLSVCLKALSLSLTFISIFCFVFMLNGIRVT